MIVFVSRPENFMITFYAKKGVLFLKKSTLKSYDNGSINSYLVNKKLSIEEDPAGESYVKQGVSDNLSDKRNSVFSPAASTERKIQVIDVAVEK